MSRSFYDIDAAGEVLCTYTDSGEKEKLKSVSVNVPSSAMLSKQWPTNQQDKATPLIYLDLDPSID